MVKMMRCYTESKYIQFMLLMMMAMTISLILQTSIFLVGALICELVGLQAENTFCQLYFTIDAEDPMKKLNTTSPKRWCLIWRDNYSGGRGMRCRRAYSVFSHNKPSQTAESTTPRPAKAVAKTPAKSRPNGTAPVWTLSELMVEKIKPQLPQIQLKAKSLKPKIWINRKRPPVEVVMALSIYKLLDSDDSRLLSTLDTLFLNIPTADQHKYLVMVFITEILDDTYAQKLIEKMLVQYAVQVVTGLMEIVIPKDNFYTSLFQPKVHNVSEETRRKHRFWRKQCMDHIYMMLLAQGRGKYYLQLSHDMVTRKDFLSSITKALNKNSRRNWVVLRFSSTGIIGKLMHNSDLMNVTQKLSRLSKNKPADHHVEEYINQNECLRTKSSLVRTPAKKCKFRDKQVEEILFRYKTPDTPIHAKGKNEKKKDTLEEKDPMWKSLILTSETIEGYVPCSAIRVNNDLLPFLASGSPFMVITGASSQGRIDISFDPPLQITRLKLVTGIPGDFRHSLGGDTTVWVFAEKRKAFTQIGNFNSDGDFKATLHPTLRKVMVLEILMGFAYQPKEIFLSEVTVTVMCQSATRVHMSSTASIAPSAAPSWYTKPPPRELPRWEGTVLVSY